MSAAKKIISVFDYHDYRQFLADRISQPGPEAKSLRAWAKEVGVSPSFLSLVLKSKRHLSEKVAEQIARSMQMAPSEKDFFVRLVNLGGEKHLEGKKSAYKRMTRTKLYSASHHEDQVIHQYITHWYYIAIREMASQPGFSFDPKWIKEKLNFSVPLAQVKEAVKFLLENKFIEVDADGRPKALQREIKCDGTVLRLAQAEFHEQMVNLGVKSFFHNQQTTRDLLGKTVLLTDAEFGQAKEIIQAAFRQIQSIADVSERDKVQLPKRVYQMSSLAFALTEIIQSGLKLVPSRRSKSGDGTDDGEPQK